MHRRDSIRPPSLFASPLQVLGWRVEVSKSFIITFPSVLSSYHKSQLTTMYHFCISTIILSFRCLPCTFKCVHCILSVPCPIFRQWHQICPSYPCLSLQDPRIHTRSPIVLTVARQSDLLYNSYDMTVVYN